MKAVLALAVVVSALFTGVPVGTPGHFWFIAAAKGHQFFRVFFCVG